MIEEWRPISGFEGLYEVSNLGRVRSLPRHRVRGCILAGSSAGKGYRKAILCDKDRQLHRYIHDIVLETFVGPRPPGMEGAHRNGKRDDNRLANLRWDTRSGNHADKYIHGTACIGEKHGRRKPNAAQVKTIRAANGDQNVIADSFGISRSQVYRIKTGQNWGSLA